MSASSRVSRSSACSQSPTRPPIVYITTRPSLGKNSFFWSLSCQTSSPPRPTRAPLRPSVPLQRMLSERQTQVIQVGFCNIPNRWRCLSHSGPLQALRWAWPLSPMSSSPGQFIVIVLGLIVYRTVWTDFSMLIQRAQSGSTAIVLCFLMGAFSFALAAPSEIVRMSYEFASSHA